MVVTRVVKCHFVCNKVHYEVILKRIYIFRCFVKALASFPAFMGSYGLDIICSFSCISATLLRNIVSCIHIGSFASCNLYKYFCRLCFVCLCVYDVNKDTNKIFVSLTKQLTTVTIV